MHESYIAKNLRSQVDRCHHDILKASKLITSMPNELFKEREKWVLNLDLLTSSLPIFPLLYTVKERIVS
jgi:hypothetical protein